MRAVGRGRPRPRPRGRAPRRGAAAPSSLGTVMVDPVLLALRRVAQEAASAERGLSRRTGHDEGPVRVDRAFDRCSPDGIRTRATALRGRRARPLHNGAVVLSGPSERAGQRERTLPNGRAFSEIAPGRNRGRWLGYQDSNLERMNQNHQCCQLHHTPWGIPSDGPRAGRRAANRVAILPARLARPKSHGAGPRAGRGSRRASGRRGPSGPRRGAAPARPARRRAPARPRGRPASAAPSGSVAASSPT